jgi:hypothetical protein
MAMVTVTTADSPPHASAVPAVVTPMVSVVIDLLDFGLAIAGRIFQRRTVQFVKDTMCAGHAGYGIHRPYGDRDGGSTCQAEYPGEECSSVHWILQLSRPPRANKHTYN